MQRQAALERSKQNMRMANAERSEQIRQRANQVPRSGLLRARRAQRAWRAQVQQEQELEQERAVQEAVNCQAKQNGAQDGAKKSRLGKDFAAAVFVSEHEAVIHHRKSGKSKEDIYADPAFTIRKGVKVQLARIIRIRPMIPSGWWLHCTIEFDESIVNEAQVLASTQEAGSLCGIGDWRPKFGRFSVEKA